jgi:hypothetical protein
MMFTAMTHAASNSIFAGKLKFVLGLLVCGLIGIGLAFQILGTGETNNNGIYKLREVSVFEPGKDNFLRGQMCRCQDNPFSEVKNYPAFTSQVPIFGSVRFGGRLDETNSGLLFYFAADESRGTGKGYDRFYFDSNRDLDLRNDPVTKLQMSPPDHGYKPNFSGIKAVAAFDFLKVNLGTNSGSPDLVEIMPRLLLTGDDKETYRYLFFVRTRLFEGDIRIAGEKFHAQLGDDHVISPSPDFPGTALVLSQGKNTFEWWGGDRISAMHKVNSLFFSFSATQDGELTVHPYQGDLGTFEIGSGTRKLTNTDFSLTGSFEARDWAVAAGGDIINGRPVEASRCQVPVGDYLPEFLTLQFGRLRIQLSQNYHSEGKRQSRDGRPNVYGITIRKDQPFALDFSNQPEVMFTSPTNSQRVKPGDTLMVAAVLVDPKLDIMIRGLADTSRKQTKDAEGKPLGYERNLSLDPTVIITRANGEKVVEGVMPFG